MKNKLMKMREQLKKKDGFTLMELIVVIAIIGILTATLMPQYVEYTDKAFGTTALSDSKTILTTGTAYAMDNTAMPTLAELATRSGFKADGTSTTVGKLLADGADATKFVYTFVRGGTTVTANIDLTAGTIVYTVTGGDAPKIERVKKALGVV